MEGGGDGPEEGGGGESEEGGDEDDEDDGEERQSPGTPPPMLFRDVFEAELKKDANLANQVWRTLWESRNILTKNVCTFVDLLGYVAIYALLRKFSG